MSNYWDIATHREFPPFSVNIRQEFEFQNYWRQHNCSWELTKELLIKRLIKFEKEMDKKYSKMSDAYIDYFKSVLKYISDNICNSSISNTSILEPIIYELFQNLDAF